MTKVLCYLFFSRSGSGTARYAHELLRELAKIESLDVTLACGPSHFAGNGAEYRITPILREIYHPNKFRRRLRFLIGQFVNPRRAIRHAANIGADWIHFFNLNQVSAPMWLPTLRRSGLRASVTCHDAFRNRGLICPAYDNGQLKLCYESMNRIFIHAEVQQVAMRFRCRLDATVFRRVSVGPYSYGQATMDRAMVRHGLALPASTPVLLFFGAVRDDKRLENLIRGLVKHRGSIHLLIAGRFSSRQRFDVNTCRQLITELGLEESITLIDRFIEEHEIPNLFCAADAVALTYDQSFSSQSAVLNVATEYRRPILGTDTGGIGEMLRRFDLGVLVSRPEPSLIEDGIAELLAGLKSEQYQGFDDYAEATSWRKSAAMMAEAFQTSP